MGGGGFPADDGSVGVQLLVRPGEDAALRCLGMPVMSQAGARGQLLGVPHVAALPRDGGTH